MPVRAIPLSHRTHIIGRQPLAPGMRPIAHESSLERDFVLLCRFDPDVVMVEEQPVTIDWADAAGRLRRYTPDYRVVRRSSTEIVEVKYRADLKAGWEAFRPAFAAARNWAVLQGMRFRIATDHGIRGPRLANARRLVPRQGDPADPEIAARILDVLTGQGCRFSDVVTTATTPEIPSGIVLATLWGMIARGRILADLNQEITGSSLLWRPPS